MVIAVPPANGPEFGETAVTVGRRLLAHVKFVALVAVLIGLVIVKVTAVVAASDGVTMRNDVSDSTENDAAAVGVGDVLNRTAVVPVNPDPVTMIGVPPSLGPLAGVNEVMLGALRKVKSSFEPLLAEVPPAVVTDTVTTPTERAGEVAVICVAELTVNVVAAVAPKLTAVAPVKLVPVMVTDVPPAVVPNVGLTAVTVGAAT
jgi:hypothetical protein